jgi:hypothetical protein
MKDYDLVGRSSVEITPEMVEAGLITLYEFDIGQPTDHEMRRAVRAVFVSMLQRRR